MAITSEIIGKLGGADVEVTPVVGSIANREGTRNIHTVEVPAGEPYLAVVIGSGTVVSALNATLDMSIGGKMTRQKDGAHMTAAAVISETSSVSLHSDANGESTFTGHLYTVKI